MRPFLSKGLKIMSSLKNAPLRGLVFDMDGTLTVPCLDFKKLRKLLGITDSIDVLSHVAELSGAEKEKAMSIIENFEVEGRQNLEIQPGAKELFSFLGELSDFNLGLVTRNSPEGVDHFLERFVDVGVCAKNDGIFSIVLTRDFKPVKPDPAPLFHIAKRWETEPKNLIMVGDDKNDIQCGKAAGAATILLNNEKNLETRKLADFNVDKLHDIIPIVKDRL